MTAYVSAQPGAWSTAATWTPAGVPGPGDTVSVLHAVTVDAPVAVGTSQPAFSGTGPGVNAVSVYGPQGSAYGGQNASGALSLAPGVTLTAMGDVLCATGPLNLGAGAQLIFDSTQATPATTSYVLEVINSYGTTAGRLVCQGTQAARCRIAAVAGSGAPRITAGEKVLGYSTYDCGILQAACTDFVGLGDASHLSATYRIGGPTAGAPYAWTLSDCTFQGCGDVAPYSSVSGAVNWSVSGCTFNGSLGPNGFKVDVSDASQQSGFARSVAGSTFDMPLDIANGAFVTVSGNVLLQAHAIVVTGLQAGLQVTGNLIYVPPGYAGGGGWSVSHGTVYTGNAWVLNSPQDVNSHVILLNGGAGSTTISGNSFLLDQTPAGFFGGNCIILEAAASGDATTNIVTISKNLVLPAANTTSSGTGGYIAAGTLVTLLQAAAQQNFSVVIEHNTCCTPRGIGSLDPDENAAGAAGIFRSIRGNLFWYPVAAVGYAVWWNVNGGARVATTDEVLSADLDYNAQWNVLSSTTCVSGGAAIATPGYQNGVFSSGTPGTHDVQANPGFADHDANICTWDSSLGGPGTTAHAVAQLAAGAAGYTVAAYQAYLSAAFTPSNLALRGASFDGQVIGAFPVVYVPPAPTVVGVSAPAGSYRAGSVILVAVTFSSAVTLPKPPWRERTEAYIQHLEHAEADILLVSCADKVHNARAICTDVRTHGLAVFERFKAGQDGTIWHYRALADAFRRLLPGALSDELRDAVAVVETLGAGTDRQSPPVPAGLTP